MLLLAGHAHHLRRVRALHQLHQKVTGATRSVLERALSPSHTHLKCLVLWFHSAASSTIWRAIGLRCLQVVTLADPSSTDKQHTKAAVCSGERRMPKSSPGRCVASARNPHEASRRRALGCRSQGRPSWHQHPHRWLRATRATSNASPHTCVVGSRRSRPGDHVAALSKQ